MITNNKCKVCKTVLREQIEKLMIENNSSQYVETWCNDHNFSISHTSIIRHMNNHYRNEYGEYVTNYNKKENKDDILTELEKSIIEDDLETYQEFLNRFKVDIKKLQSNDDYEKLYGSYQQIISEIIVKSLYLIDINLEKTIKNDGKYPVEKIKSLRLLLEINDKINPINMSLNINRAIQLISDNGFVVSEKVE